MKILFLALPLSGHLHPQIELAKGCPLDECIFLNVSYRSDLIQSHGFTFYPLGDEFISQIDDFAQTQVTSQDGLKRTRKAMKNLGPVFDSLYRQTISYLEDLKPDVVVVDFSTIWGGYAAESVGIPFVTTNPSPMVNDTTNEWEDVPFLLGWSKGNRWKNKLGWTVIRTLQKISKYDYPWFRWYRPDGSMAQYSNRLIFNLGMRELEFNHFQPVWTSWIGYPIGVTENILVTLPSGFEKRVLVAFGTLLSEVLVQQIKPIIKSLSKKYPNHLFVITYGDSQKGTDLLGQGNFYEIGYLPYGVNVRQFDYVIHHGGPGIVFECLKNAIPSIVLPQAWDQFDYAQRLDYFEAAIYCKKVSQLEEAYKTLLSWKKDALLSLQEAYQRYDTKVLFREQLESLIREDYQ